MPAPRDVDALLRDVGRQLRAARKALRLSQAQVAARAGLTPNTVYLIEAGANTRLSSVLAVGRSSREIGDHLQLSVRTVDTHLARVSRKLGINGRSELESALEG